MNGSRHGIYTYNGILLSHKNEWNFCHLQQHGWTWRALHKWNKSDRERQILYDITYVESKSSKLVNRTKKQTHRFREWTCGYQWEEEWGKGNRGVGAKWYKLSCIKLATSIYCTAWGYSQCFSIHINGIWASP